MASVPSPFVLFVFVRFYGGGDDDGDGDGDRDGGGDGGRDGENDGDGP